MKSSAKSRVRGLDRWGRDRRRWARILVLSIAFTVGIAAARPESAVSAERKSELRPRKLEEPPRIDGWFDEPIWQDAEIARDFVQQRPFTGELATQSTEVRVLYSEAALYVGFICLDSNPQSIRHRSLGRDPWLGDEDYFAMVIDTYLDRQNGYYFQVNPDGARRDLSFADEGEQQVLDWDGAWKVRTRIVDEGWQGEIEIPWRTLRFPRTERVSMGINFERQKRSVNEQSHWCPIDRQFDIFRVSDAGTIADMEGIEPGRNVLLRPYGLLRAERGDPRDPEAYAQQDWQPDAEIGLDAKVGLTSNLTLDLTVNTDFAQVEVDDELVNLTRFPLFFPEKREFFLEKAELFRFGSPSNRLFFSRRIGLDDQGNTLPIHYGTRLTGKLGGTEIGLLDIKQGAEGGIPSRRFDVLRVSQDVGHRSSVGIMGVARSSGNEGELDEPTNLGAGIDGNFWPGDRLLLSLYGSLTDEDGAGPDKQSWGGRARFSHPLYVLTLLHESYGNDYDPKAGFLPRPGIQQTAVGWEFTPEPNWRWIRRFENQGFFYWIDRRHGPFESRYIHVNPVAVGHSEQRLGVFWERDFERLFEEFQLGEVVFPMGDYTFDFGGLSLSSDPSQAVNAELSSQFGEFYDGTRTSVAAKLIGRWAPHWTTSLELESDRVRRDDELSGQKQEFDSDLIRFRLALDVNNQLSFDLFTQWSATRELVLSQFRGHYIFGEESDLYLVITDERDDAHGRYAPRRGEWTLKLSYALRL